MAKDTGQASTPMGWRGRLGLAAFLGFVALTQVPAMRRRGFWLDEAFSIAATHDLTTVARRTSGTMVAFYAALSPWATISEDRTWLRFLPLLFALAALAVLFVQTRHRFGDRTALIALVTTAASPVFLRWSTELRSYSLALLLVALSWFALLRWIDEDDGDPGSRWRWIWASAGLLAVLAHGLAAIQLACQFGAIACHPRRRSLLPRTWPGLSGPIVASVLWLAGAHEIGRQASFGRTSLVAMWVGFAAAPWPARLAWTALLGAAVIAGVVAVARGRGADRWTRTAVLWWAVGTPAIVLTVSIARSYLRVPYLMGSIPGLALLLGLALADLDQPKVTGAALALVALLGAQTVWATWQDEGDHWREAATYITEIAEPGDALVVPSGYRRAPFDVGWHEVNGTNQHGLVAAYPTQPLGEALRYYDDRPPVLVDPVLATEPERIILVDQPASDDRNLALEFAQNPEASATYEVVDERTFDREITVVVLERR